MDEVHEEVLPIPLEDATLEGALALDGRDRVVVFAHGSGSSRTSPRNNAVADVLRDAGLGTLLFDLLTEEEDRDRDNRFDVPLLTERLLGTTDWLREREGSDLSIGYFGASTGAAAALRAAARDDRVGAVVSRGGRVDMAEEALGAVGCPTLFVVGGADEQVLALNRDAYDELTCEKALHVVEGAGHLFEGAGELEEVAIEARDWFDAHL